MNDNFRNKLTNLAQKSQTHDEWRREQEIIKKQKEDLAKNDEVARRRQHELRMSEEWKKQEELRNRNGLRSVNNVNKENIFNISAVGNNSNSSGFNNILKQNFNELIPDNQSKDSHFSSVVNGVKRTTSYTPDKMVTNLQHFVDCGNISDGDSDSDSGSDGENYINDSVIRTECSKCTSNPESVNIIFKLIKSNLVNEQPNLTLSGCNLNFRINAHLNLSDFMHLRKIVITNNNIGRIDFDIFPQGIKELILCNNQITQIDMSRSLPLLQILDLSNNMLRVLRNINDRSLPALQRLIISKNNLIGALSNIINLEQMKKLIFLDLSFNKLTSIEHINKYSQLQNIKCTNNNLHRIAIMSEKLKRIDFSVNTNLRRLTLQTCNLIDLIAIGRFDNLEPNGVRVFVHSICKTDVSDEYKNVLSIESPSVIKMNKPSQINFTDTSSSVYRQDSRTAEYYNTTHDYRKYNSYNQTHIYHGPNTYKPQPVARKLTREDIDFYICKSIENYVKQMQLNTDYKFRNLMDENYVYLDKEVIV
jgi:hypothetical protein